MLQPGNIICVKDQHMLSGSSLESSLLVGVSYIISVNGFWASCVDFGFQRIWMLQDVKRRFVLKDDICSHYQAPGGRSCVVTSTKWSIRCEVPLQAVPTGFLFKWRKTDNDHWQKCSSPSAASPSATVDEVEVGGHSTAFSWSHSCSLCNWNVGKGWVW